MEQDKNNDGPIVYYDNGERKMSFYDFIKPILPETPITPTHNYHLIKEHRLRLYAKKELDYIKEREIDKVQTTQLDKQMYYCDWLKKELDIIKKWVSNNEKTISKWKLERLKSNTNEIKKYQAFVETELKQTESKVHKALYVDKNMEENIESVLHLPAEQCEYLFNELIKREFIPKTTDKDIFYFVLGSKSLENKKFTALKWLKSKLSLSELIKLITGEKTVSRKDKKTIEKTFTDKRGKPMKDLPNSKINEYSADYLTLEKIVRNMKNPPIQTPIQNI